jgi:hypothetical protein
MCTKFITSEFISETHAEKRPFGEMVLGLHFPDDLGCEFRDLRSRIFQEGWAALNRDVEIVICPRSPASRS